jgi:hypothetical protein
MGGGLTDPSDQLGQGAGRGRSTLRSSRCAVAASNGNPTLQMLAAAAVDQLAVPVGQDETARAADGLARWRSGRTGKPVQTGTHQPA